jgi:hypothetical protein
MPKPDHRSQMARAWLHFHAARKGRGSGSAAPPVNWPVYPRHAENNTVAEGGNRGSAENARQNGVSIALAEGRPEDPSAQPSYGAHVPSIPTSRRMASLYLSLGPPIALRRARTAALCPDPPGFSFAIVGAMLTQVIVGSREAQKAIPRIGRPRSRSSSASRD